MTDGARPLDGSSGKTGDGNEGAAAEMEIRWLPVGLGKVGAPSRARSDFRESAKSRDINKIIGSVLVNICPSEFNKGRSISGILIKTPLIT